MHCTPLRQAILCKVLILLIALLGVHSLQAVQKPWWNSDTIDRPQRPLRDKMSAAISDRGADASRLGTESGQDEVSTGGGGRLG